MKFRRILSIILCAALLFTGALPVNAAISFNGGGGNTYPGTGAGPANWNWSPGSTINRFGYRISVYYAQQQRDGAGNYITDDNGNPVYDWESRQKVGNTIDIRREPMYNTSTKSIIKPSQWGVNSAFEYAQNGGAFGSTFQPMVQSWGYNYYYYAFNNDDRYVRNTDGASYICGVFNTDTARNSDVIPNEAKANEIVSLYAALI